MAPSDVEIAKTLKQVVKKAFGNPEERDILSVSYARKRAEEQLALPDGYLTEEQWKAKSKDIIKSYIDELLAREEEPEPPKRQSPKPTKPAKRSAPAQNQSTSKRQKKSKSSDDESELSSAPSSDLSEPDSGEFESESEPERKKAPQKGSRAKADPKTRGKKQRSKNVVESDEEESATTADKGEADEAKPASDNKDEVIYDSDLSSLIDEEPKSKKSKKSTSEGKKPKAASKPSKAADVSPAEAEIKKLQSQLVKCGVRKIWAFELKQYGDDSKAKIRHLQKMLKDVGMDGRFSEARAREIKEARELAADLEAIQGAEKHWGAGRSSRSRKAAPVMQDLSDEEGEDDDENEEENSEGYSDKAGRAGRGSKPGSNEAAQRAARAQQDLAFLGDEEDSDE